MKVRTRCTRCGYAQEVAVPEPGETFDVVRCGPGCTALGAVWRTRTGAFRWDGYHAPMVGGRDGAVAAPAPSVRTPPTGYAATSAARWFLGTLEAGGRSGLGLLERVRIHETATAILRSLEDGGFVRCTGPSPGVPAAYRRDLVGQRYELTDAGRDYYRTRPTAPERTPAGLAEVRVLYRAPGALDLWGLPYELRPGQNPRDLVDARGRVPEDWVWLGSPGWWGSLTQDERDAVRWFLADLPRGAEPGRPGEWSSIAEFVRR